MGICLDVFMGPSNLPMKLNDGGWDIWFFVYREIVYTYRTRFAITLKFRQNMGGRGHNESIDCGLLVGSMKHGKVVE